MDPLDDLFNRAWARAAGPRRFPEATYRLQFHAGFTFRDAARLAGYLADLGVTHCYASPYLRARPGSTHGYDIIDHNALNPEVGTPDDYDAFVAALHDAGLGQVLDVVPNHMGVATDDNAWWNDVLENGPASRYAGHFDVAWRASPRPELQDRVLLPVLGEPYGDVLEGGQLRLRFGDGAFGVTYFDRRFPIDPGTYPVVLGDQVADLEAALGPDAPALAEYHSVLTAARNLPAPTETDPDRVAERAREKEVVKRRLAGLAAGSEPVRAFIEAAVARFNGKPGDPASFDALDALLDRQCYRLAYWRVAPDEINYRRFFDVNDLAALSMERLDVFDAAHGLVLDLLAAGKVDGLRIDHPDGLYDPAQYFLRLQEAALLAHARASHAESGGAAWDEVEGPLRERIRAGLAHGDGPRRWPLYVVAEKILAPAEPLPPGWAVHGTSGYDFLAAANGLFVARENGPAFTRLYADLTGEDARFAEAAYRGKLLVLNVSLSGELYTLTDQLHRLARRSRATRDFTFNTLRRALREVIACFPVYRSYIDAAGPGDADRRYVAVAVGAATARNPLLGRRVFRFIRDMLLLESPASFTAEDRASQRRFAGKFQQVTAPVTAKGVEDTAFYVHTRLVSLNEVGGDPGRFGLSADGFHAFNAARQAAWPYALSPLSTHDTKRSEDIRARLNVLSEMPDEWAAAVGRWRALNAPHRAEVDGAPAPDANEEHLLYQTLVGAWPLEPYGPAEYTEFAARVRQYLAKALHEAKVHSSWINPNDEYDQAVDAFVGRVLDPANRAFLDDLAPFRRKVAHYGLYNSLAQTLLRLTCPGVPDTYQGTELWDFSLVDPDNRRPVDYEKRAALLRDLRDAAGSDLPGLCRDLLEAKEDGRVKLYLTWRALRCRRDHPGLFSAGEYHPLAVQGERPGHVIAFARRSGERRAVVAVPRLPTRLVPDSRRPPVGDVWADTHVLLGEADAATRWRDVLTGEVVAAGSALAAADLFRHLPVALLLDEPAG